jgi:hypothetical protein
LPTGQSPPPATLDALLTRLPEFAGQVWIHESALDWLGLPEDLSLAMPTVGHPWLAGTKIDHLAPWMRHKRIEIAVPAWEGHTTGSGEYFNRCPWYGTGGPLELHWELSAFRATTGHRWVRSGAVTSDAMLLDHWGEKIQLAHVPDEALAETRLEPPALSARAELDDAERKARWLYGFDLNANYLGAASNLALPTGRATASGLWTSEHTPLPTLPGWWKTPTGWRTTPGLGRMRDRHLVGGWAFPDYHQYLQPWYKALRDARAVLVPGPALKAVKAVYQQGWGRLMSTQRGTGSWAQRLYQPYWGQAVQANARERLRRRIGEMPQAPVAVDTDAIFVLSSHPDARILAVALGLKIGDGLGEWHALGRAGGKSARAVLGNPDPGAVVAELRGMVK